MFTLQFGKLMPILQIVVHTILLQTWQKVPQFFTLNSTVLSPSSMHYNVIILGIDPVEII